MTSKLKASYSKTAAEIHISDQNIFSVLANITDCHFELDKVWRFIRINNQALTHFGKKEDAMG